MSRPRIVAVLPSRGRPEQAARLIDRCHQTSTAEILLVVDDDDPTLERYADSAADCIITTGTRGFAEAINVGARFALDHLDAAAVMWLGDDVWPVTEGWAEALLSALDGRPGIAYGDDLYQRERLPTHPLVTADVLSAVGYFAPPGFVHLFVDNVWRDIGHSTATLTYVPSVVIEHRHPAARKATVDEHYARTNSPATYARDAEAYFAWQDDGMEAAIAAVLHLLKRG